MVLSGQRKPEEGLQSNLQTLSEALARWDLKVNWKTTKVMKVARERGDCGVRVGDQAIEQVDKMKYLGVTISSNGRMQKEVEARNGSAMGIIGGMSKAVLRRRELSKGTTLKVVNATMMPSSLYGCEVWSIYDKAAEVKSAAGNTDECIKNTRSK